MKKAIVTNSFEATKLDFIHLLSKRKIKIESISVDNEIIDVTTVSDLQKYYRHTGRRSIMLTVFDPKFLEKKNKKLKTKKQ